MRRYFKIKRKLGVSPWTMGKTPPPPVKRAARLRFSCGPQSDHSNPTIRLYSMVYIYYGRVMS